MLVRLVKIFVTDKVSDVLTTSKTPNVRYTFSVIHFDERNLIMMQLGPVQAGKYSWPEKK